MATARFPRGSEWRRWDLHVHTPESVLHSEFSDWDTYVSLLEEGSKDVKVLGATDYCSVAGYRKILDYRANGRLSGFDLILPNIEFRIAPQTASGQAINIHLLVSPQDPNHLGEIESALQKLTYTYNGTPYSCTVADLQKLGKAHDPSIKDDTKAFKQGVLQFKPSFEVFRDWYTGHRWLCENALVAVSNGSDGASGLSKDAGFSATREELYRFANLILSASPKDRLYFLGQGTDSPDEVKRKMGRAKPCANGSDSHEDGTLFKPAQQRYCWIKADPTFEGLRQIIYEPEDRVYIGPTPPTSIDESKIIKSLSVKGADDWFATPAIEFNSGLVAIIGEKGSGKTALVDLIAFSAAAWTGEDKSSSFIQKARPYLDNVAVELGWLDGEVMPVPSLKEPRAELPAVRYLSQDFVEELCSQDTSGDALIREIENVVFSCIPDDERLEASSFEDLRREKTDAIVARRNSLRGQVSRLNREIVQLEDTIGSRLAKEKLVEKTNEDIAAIDRQLPSLQKTVDKDVEQKLTREREALQSKTKDLTEQRRLLSRVASAKERFDAFKLSVDEEFSSLEQILRGIGLADTEISCFRPTFAPDAMALLNKKEEALKKEVDVLKGDAEKTSKDGVTIADIQARIKDLEGALAADEKERQRLLALQRQKATLVAEKERLAKEIADIETKAGASLEAKREERWKAYLAFFELLAKEQTALASLYAPVSAMIAADPSGAKAGFELSVTQNVAFEDWVESGRVLLDLRKASPLKTDSSMSEHGRTLVSAWKQNDKDSIRTALEQFKAAFPSSTAEIDDLLSSHASRAEFYDWLFSTDKVTLDYGLKYDGSELSVLSPGTRGIVLLILYLEMDRQDRRPLIIDQPEGNLDSASIYSSLVPYLRRAKKDRQVILVTHNPNLVIAADADQVIVAGAKKKLGEAHPTIEYTSGSLEDCDGDLSIRESACRLLEGGREAFRTREDRYSK